MAAEIPALPPMPAHQRRELSALLLAAVHAAFGRSLECAIVKGSAYKGDFIPGYSDFDMHVFVRDPMPLMLDQRTPSLAHTLALQRAISAIDAARYGAHDVQLMVLDAARYPAAWTPPLPGVYEVVHGALPPDLPAVTADDVLQRAHAFLPFVRRDLVRQVHSLVDLDDTRLAEKVRLLGTFVKPAIYSAAILRGMSPLEVWTLPLARVLPAVEPDWCPSRGLSAFMCDVFDWLAVTTDGERLRSMFATGYHALHELCDHAGIGG